MKALVFKENYVTLLEKDKPEIEAANEIIVKVIKSGICGTDLRVLSGNFNAQEGVTLGHEAVGIVCEIGYDVNQINVGDRVVIDPTLYDGTCYYCKKGLHNLCDNKKYHEVGLDMDGSFAEYIKLPENFVYKLPDVMSFDNAVLIEPLACVLNNISVANISIDETVVVLGGGPTGALWTLVANDLSRKVIVVENNPVRVNFLKKHFKNVIDSTNKEYISEIISLNEGKKPNIVVDTTGIMCEEAINIVDKGGKIVLMGFNKNYTATFSPTYITNNAIKIIGAGDYNNMFEKAIEVASKYNLSEFITHTFKLSEYEDAFKILSKTPKNKCVMKVVFDMQ